MKENTKKILTLVYDEEKSRPFYVTTEHLKLFLPRLTGSGLRSVVATLKTQGLLELERMGGTSFIRITPQGKRLIEAEVPVFQTQPESEPLTWACLIFLEAPPGDKQFRYLRSLLVKYRAINLTRGVYAYPFKFPGVITEECYKSYAQSVLIGQLNNWVIGDDRRIAINHFHLLDLVQAYSGISSEIKRLIDKKKLFRDLNNQEKIHLSSLFDRLYNLFQEDYGLLPVYFSETPRGRHLLHQIQQLLD